MKRIIIFILSILTILITLSCASYLRTGSQQKSDFSFVIPCKWAEEEGICLLGKYKAGLSITLLEKGRSKSCITKSARSGEYEGEINFFSFTKVNVADACGLPDLYSVAVLKSRVWDYEVLLLEEIFDKEQIKSLNTFVRSTTVLEDLRTKAQGLISGESSVIQSDLPKLYRYPIPKINVFVVAYDESEDGRCCSGPRVILINGTAYPLTGWCSYPFMRIFRLNGEYYLESGSACCDCGITIMELFKIKPTGLVEVHSDGSLSD
jgi:hypothetical protein